LRNKKAQRGKNDGPNGCTHFCNGHNLQRGDKGERRSGSHKRLPYRVKVNRTSLDHLLLGNCADIDKLSNEPSIPRDRQDVRTT
jgi:hypothetical protein